MELQKAQDLCLELMNKHGLTSEKGWSFKWMNRTNTAGICRYKRGSIDGGVIMLSKFITPVHSDEKVKDTILHEIAHGLTKGHGHDYIWRRKAIEIGCNGERCFDVCEDLKEAKKEISKIVGTCPLCQNKWYHSRMPKRSQWCKCAGRKFKQEEKIQYVLNENIKQKQVVTEPVQKVKTSGNLNSKPDAYKNMLDKFEKEFLPLINNDYSLFDTITKNINPSASWRTKNKEIRKACNKYMFDNKLMTNAKFQEMFFYEGPMNGRTIHGKNAPWISGKPS